MPPPPPPPAVARTSSSKDSSLASTSRTQGSPIPPPQEAGSSIERGRGVSSEASGSSRSGGGRKDVRREPTVKGKDESVKKGFIHPDRKVVSTGGSSSSEAAGVKVRLSLSLSRSSLRQGFPAHDFFPSSFRGRRQRQRPRDPHGHRSQTCLPIVRRELHGCRSEVRLTSLLLPTPFDAT